MYSQWRNLTFGGPEGPISVFTVSLFMVSEYLENRFSDIKFVWHTKNC